jgi:signal transduction histidine kinase
MTKRDREVGAVNQNGMNKAVSDTLGNMEIRLREKLSVLLPALDLLEKRVAPSGDADAATLRYLAEARRAALSILRLAKNLGDQARYAVDYDMSDPVRTDLAALLSSIAAETRGMAAYKKIEVTLSCSEKPFFAFIDPEMAARLLYNLFSNAVLHGEGDVSAELWREDGFILIKVRNADGQESGLYGSGPPGSGLAVASAIVCQCGGTMVAASDKSGGTAVTVSLPDLPGGDTMEFGIPDDPCAFPRYLIEFADFPAYNAEYNLQRGGENRWGTSMP